MGSSKHRLLSNFTDISLWQEIRTIFCTFVFLSLQNIFSYLPTMTASIFIGHLSNSVLLLPGTALARSFTEVTGTSAAWGMCNSLKTLLPQTLGSNSNENNDDIKLIAVYFQRCLVVCTVFLIPLTVLQFFAGNLMCMIGEPSNMCAIATNYCRILIPFVWGYTLYSACARVGQVLNLNKEIFYITLFTGILSLPMNYFIVYYLEYGYIGTAITVDISIYLSIIILCALLIARGFAFIFKPLPFRVVCTYAGISQYLSLALPSLIRTLSSWWISEFFNLFSGFVFNPEIAVYSSSILYSFDLLSICIAEAMGTAVAIGVGKHIGSCDTRLAKRSMYCALFVGISCSAVWSVFIAIFHRKMPLIWTSNEYIMDDTSFLLLNFETGRNIIWMLYWIMVGVCNGLGWPKYSAIVTFIVQWLFALPLEIIFLFVLNFRSQTMNGLLVIWGWPSIGRFLCYLILFILISCADWRSAVMQSTSRLISTRKDYGSTKIISATK